MRNTQIIGLAAFLTVTVAAWQGTARAAFNGILPAPVQDVTARQYGDFWAYSLPYLSNLYVKSPGLLPGITDAGAPPGAFLVQSGAGQIQDLVVLGTGANGQPVTTNDPALMDDAYDLPSSPATSFDTDPKDPKKGSNNVLIPLGVDFDGDTQGSWSARLSAIQLALGPDGQFVMFFNLNQNNAGNQNALSPTGFFGPTGAILYDQDLLVWAKATISKPVNPSNLSQGYTELASFYLTGNYATKTIKPDEQNPFTVNSGTQADDHWVQAFGRIAVDPSTGLFLHLGPPNVGEDFINQNLGADEAAFAIWSKELDTLIRTSDGDYVLDVNYEYAANTNGYEQLFVRPTVVQEHVPEPSAIVGLVGLGCIWAAGWAWRRRRARA